MPQLNVDSLFEPLTVVIEEKEYKVVKMTAAVMKKAQSFQKRMEKDEQDLSAMLDMLAVFLDCKPAVFENLDVRQLAAIMNFLTQEMEKAKNPIAGDSKSQK